MTSANLDIIDTSLVWVRCEIQDQTTTIARGRGPSSLTRMFETKDATEENTAAIEREGHRLSFGVMILLIRVIVDSVGAVAKSSGFSY